MFYNEATVAVVNLVLGIFHRKNNSSKLVKCYFELLTGGSIYKYSKKLILENHSYKDLKAVL